MVGTRGLEPLTPTVSMWFGLFPLLPTSAQDCLFQRVSEILAIPPLSIIIYS